MIRIGTAGWGIPQAVRTEFAGDGPLLTRYARVLSCVEINSSFYRPHRAATYARWAAETPDAFRFAVKLPRTVTHDARLVGVEPALDRFLDEVAGLGSKLGVLLVQLPPSLAFDARVACAFLALLRARHPGPIVCEPRHASWFDAAAGRAMREFAVSRAGADPASMPAAARPGGSSTRHAVRYRRWHGSPRMYWSRYDDAWLAEQAAALDRDRAAGERWCIFDNTAAGAALENALAFRALVDGA